MTMRKFFSEKTTQTRNKGEELGQLDVFNFDFEEIKQKTLFRFYVQKRIESDIKKIARGILEGDTFRSDDFNLESVDAFLLRELHPTKDDIDTFLNDRMDRLGKLRPLPIGKSISDVALSLRDTFLKMYRSAFVYKPNHEELIDRLKELDPDSESVVSEWLLERLNYATKPSSR